MKALIKYSLHDYVRSHKYFLPVATYIILVIVQYAYKPNPVIDTYSITALLLFISSAWLSISFLSQDKLVQKQLLILHSRGVTRYYLAKLIGVLLIATMLAIFAFLYPIVFTMFKEPVTMTVGAVLLFNHFMLALLGVSVASFFTNGLLKSPVNMYGGLTLTLVVSITATGIFQELPSLLKNLIWIIPPASNTQMSLINWTGKSLADLAILPFAWTLIYSIVLIALFLKIVKKLA